VARLSEEIAKGIEMGIFRPVVPDAVSEVFLGAIREFNISNIEKQISRTPEEQLQLISNIVIDGIRSK
jgi:hypothetical protein